MGIVSWMTGSVNGYLDDIAGTTFGALANGLGTIFLLMATLAIVVVAVNAVMQYRSVDFRTTIILLLKISLIAIFSANWTQFNAVTGAIITAMESLAGIIMSSLGGGSDASAEHFSGEFDILVAFLQDVLNSAINSMNWVGGAVFAVFGAALLAVMAALAGIVIIFAKVMITFYVSIAPLMILLSMFSVTKDYFQSWLSGLISYAFYPVVIAAVFATIIGMMKQMTVLMGDPDAATSLGHLIPFVVMAFIAIVSIALIPMIVRQVSGNIQLASLTSAPMAGLSVLQAARLSGLLGGRNRNRDRDNDGSATRGGNTNTSAQSAAAARAARAARIASR